MSVQHIAIKTTKARYRLLADGTIYDQITNNSVGYLTSSETEEAWHLGGISLQKYLIEKLK